MSIVKMVNRVLKRRQQLLEVENRRTILNLIEESKSARLLDCGCYDGSFTKELSKRIVTGQLYGIEICQELAQSAEEKGIRVYNSDLNEPFPFESESFDVVHANQVIEHLPNTDGFIREVYRILKRGGYAVISTPNLAAYSYIVTLILGAQPSVAHVSDEVLIGELFFPLPSAPGDSSYIPRLPSEIVYPGHQRIFTCNALKGLFLYHGFDVEKVIGVGYTIFPARMARFLSRLGPKHATYLVMKARKV